MSIQNEAKDLAGVISRMHINTEMSLGIAPGFEGREDEVKKAVETELERLGERAVVEVNGHLSLRASTFSQPN